MSNTTYCRGLLSRSRFCSNWKDGRPSSSRATISPSSTACFTLTSPLIACSCGYSLSTIRPERVWSETFPLSVKLFSLLPSHLASKSQRSLSNGSSTSCAFIGSRLLGIGPFSALARLISPPSPSARLLDHTASFPCSISSLVRPVFTEVSNFSMSKRSEEHTSELQSPYDLVCRLLLETKKQPQT